MSSARYTDVFTGEARWAGLAVGGGAPFDWDLGATHVPSSALPGRPEPVADIVGRVLAVLRVSVTADHTCPAARIPVDGRPGRGVPAGPR